MSLVQPVTKMILSKIQAHGRIQVMYKVQTQLHHLESQQRKTIFLTLDSESLQPGGPSIHNIPRMMMIQELSNIQVHPEVQPELHHIGSQQRTTTSQTVGSESLKAG